MGKHYAYGWALTGRKSGTNEYRYGHQGQYAKEDQKNGWNSFE